jgi:protein-tyrosine phosphatase
VPNSSDTEFPPYLKADVGEHVAGIRNGVLFRSAWGIEPGLPGAVDDPVLKIDMRGRRYVTAEELALDHSRIVIVPVEQPRTSSVLSADATREDYTANYLGMLDSCGEAFAQVIEAVAAGLEDGGCVLGCSIGRDRTGMVLALVLRGLGFAPDEILTAEAEMREGLADLVSVSPHTFEGMTREQVLQRLRAAHEPVIDSIGLCERRWGSVRSYLSAHGLDAGTWGRLERALLILDAGWP